MALVTGWQPVGRPRRPLAWAHPPVRLGRAGVARVHRPRTSLDDLAHRLPLHRSRRRPRRGSPCAAGDASLPLGVLPASLRDEPALTQVLGRTSAVPGRARAGAGHRRRRAGPAVRAAARSWWPCPPRPTPSAWPTTSAAFLGSGRGRAVPGVGDAAVRAGEPRRRDDGPPAADACGACATPTGPRGRGGAGAGPGAAARPARRGRRADRGRAPATRSTRRAGRPAGRRRATGASTRSSTAARWRCGARSSTCSRPPPTRPVRIDLWGDEVDRLTEFSVTDQRSTVDLAEVEIFPCRELLPTDEVRARAARAGRRRAVGPRAVGAAGRGPDLRRHGVVAAVAHRGRAHAARPARPDAQVLLVEPRRMRDRAADILAEEADLAATPGRDLGAPTRRATSRRLHLPFDRLLAHTEAPAWTVTDRARRPRRGHRGRRRLGPVVGDGDAPGQPAPRPAGRRLPRRRGRRRRRHRRPARHPAARRRRATSIVDDRARRDLHRARAAPSWSQPLERGFMLPRVKLAVLAEADVTGRRRAHRGPGPGAARPSGFFDDLKPGDYVVHYQHGVGPLRRHGQAGHRRRRARLPAARVPGRRQALRPVRPDRRRAPLHRRRDARRSAAWAAATGRRPRPGCARRSPRSPRSWSCSTRSGSTPPGHAFAARHAVAARARGGLPVRARRPTS